MSKRTRIAHKRFTSAFAEHGDKSPMMVCLLKKLDSEASASGGNLAYIPAELLYPADVPGGVDLGEHGKVTLPGDTTLHAVGRAYVVMDYLYECDFVLHGRSSQDAGDAVDAFRELSAESGALVLERDLVTDIRRANSPLLLWVSNVLWLLMGTTWIKDNRTIGNRQVVSYHPFSASIEAWKILSSPSYASDPRPEWLKKLTDDVSRKVLSQSDDQKRPAYERDHEWLKWSKVDGLKPAAIRNRWNSMSDDERMKVAPRCHDTIDPGDSGRSIVYQGLKTAEREDAEDR